MRKLILITGMALSIFAVMTCTVAAQVQLHGFMQARFALANNDYTVRMDRFGLRLQQNIDDEFNWLTEVYIHPYSAPASTAYMESAYLNWNLQERLPWDFSLRIGKGRNETFAQAPYYSRRRTSDYTLFSEAYTQTRVQGIQTFSNFGPVQLAIGILNPFRTGTGRDVPDMPTGDSIKVPLGDNENADNTTDRVAFSGRLGYRNTVPVLGALNVGASAYLSETGKVPSGADNEMNRFAVDGEFKTDMGIIVQGQFLTGSTAGFDHNGGEIMGGWENARFGAYARYGMLGYDDKFQGMNQIMLSAIFKPRPTIHFRLEGLINGEDEDAAKGWAKVNNDVLFFETLFAW